MTHDEQAPPLSDDVRGLFDGLSKAHLAFLLERPPHWVAQQLEAGYLTATMRDRRAWRRFSSEQTLHAIRLSSLCRAGLLPGRASKLLAANPNYELDGLGLNPEQVAIVREAVQRAIRRAALFPQRLADTAKAREASRGKVEKAALQLDEMSRALLVQAIIESLDVPFARVAFSFGVRALPKHVKVDILRDFLHDNPDLQPSPPAELAEPKTKDLRMTASFESTQISRGECPFAGVCVKGLTLLISEGMGGQAFAAEFPETDAQKLLDQMNKALSEADGFSQTSIFTFGEQESPIIDVVVGRPLALSISAGPKGAIVAQLTTEDFTTIRDALQASLAAVANPIEIAAEWLPEGDPRREITLQ